MKQEEKSIRAMIASPDKDNVYLAVAILRKDGIDLRKETKLKLLREVALEDRIKDYHDICDELGERELLISDFNFLPEDQARKALASAKLNQIAKLVNGKWIPNWADTNEYKWFQCYEYKAGRGLVFLGSFHLSHGFYGLVVFKDEKTSDFVGKTFIDLYTDLL